MKNIQDILSHNNLRLFFGERGGGVRRERGEGGGGLKG